MTQDLSALRRYPELDGRRMLICVGAAKCATSWIHGYLGSLPEVAVSPLKEVHFFDAKFPRHALGDPEDLALRRLGVQIAQDGAPAANLRRWPAFRASVDRAQMIYDDDAYFGHFARACAPGVRTLCDITPAYAAIGADGFAYLRDFCAVQPCDLRVLFVMRDPVDRLWSNLRHMAQIVPDKAPLDRWAETIRAPKLRVRADYRGTVQALDAVFGDRAAYLFYEDLWSEPGQRALCTLADAEYRPADTGTRRNETGVTDPLPEEAAAAMHKMLAPQYAFCRDRFGAAVPASWRS